jgi:phage shock protein E
VSARRRPLALSLLACGLLVAAACSRGGRANISPADLASRIQEGRAPLVLDVRTPAEYASGHVSGAINIPYTDVTERIGELGTDRSREVVVYCETGGRAAKAQASLQAAGFTDVRHLLGDMRGWRADHLPCDGCAAP